MGSETLESLWGIAPFTLAAAAAGTAGGVLPVLRAPPERLRAYIQHCAGGVLLAIIAADLMTEIRHTDAPLAAVLGLMAGAVVMVSLKRYLSQYDTPGDDPTPTGFIAAAYIDTTIDGVLIGAAAAVDPELGVLLAIGLGFELTALTASVSSELLHLRMRRSKVIAITAGVAGCLIVGATTGVVGFAGQPPVVHAVVLAFSVSALLYLVTDELLVRGHKALNSAGTVAAFFTGFIIIAAYTFLSR